nr:MAG TPA: peptidoglycan hydrolase [Caudoviricetes sp.]
MSNSPLVSYTKLSPNHSGQRTHVVDRITPHCVVGQCSVETLGNIFAPTSRQASCQYGIGVDGRVGMYVEEKNRSWCSSSNANDQRAITIECASDATHPYAFNDTVYAKLIELCTDICKRYGKTKLLWFGDKTKTLNYEPASNEMVLTVHRWFANKSCPGDWMYARMGDLASKVTAKLGGSAGGTEKPADNLYKIQVGAFSKKANADAMAAKLKAAGFDTYITTKSGTAVSASSAKKSTDQIAREVIQGLWGNGVDRTNRLKAAGYDPSVIQNRVNQLLK